ncbi:hypothetical protein MRX96_035122 [Rhipicephalus microplus]
MRAVARCENILRQALIGPACGRLRTRHFPFRETRAASASVLLARGKRSSETVIYDEPALFISGLLGDVVAYPSDRESSGQLQPILIAGCEDRIKSCSTLQRPLQACTWAELFLLPPADDRGRGGSQGGYTAAAIPRAWQFRAVCGGLWEMMLAFCVNVHPSSVSPNAGA